MQWKKIIFTDSTKGDIAITCQIINEDDYFFTVQDRTSNQLKIGKKAIVLIKEVQE